MTARPSTILAGKLRPTKTKSMIPRRRTPSGAFSTETPTPWVLSGDRPPGRTLVSSKQMRKNDLFNCFFASLPFVFLNTQAVFAFDPAHWIVGPTPSIKGQLSPRAMKSGLSTNARMLWGVVVLSLVGHSGAWSPLHMFGVNSGSVHAWHRASAHKHHRSVHRLRMSQAAQPATGKRTLRGASTLIMTPPTLPQDPFFGLNTALSDSSLSLHTLLRAVRNALVPGNLATTDQLLNWLRLELAPWVLSLLVVSAPSALLGNCDAIVAWMFAEAVFLALCASAYPQLDRRMLPSASAVAGKVRHAPPPPPPPPPRRYNDHNHNCGHGDDDDSGNEATSTANGGGGGGGGGGGRGS